MKRLQRVDGAKGYTMVEVVFAMAIIAIAQSALVSTLTSTAKLQIRTDKHIAAKNTAQSVMETVKTYSCEEILSIYPLDTEIDMNCDVGGRFDESDEAKTLVKFTTDPLDPSFVYASVRIRWKTGEHDGQDSYSTCEMRRQIF